MAVGVSGSSSFGFSSGSTNQSANNQRFSKVFGKKNLSGIDLVTPVLFVGCSVIGVLMLKKKIGK